MKKRENKKRVKKDWRILGEEAALREAYTMEAVNRIERLEDEREENVSVDGDWKVLKVNKWERHKSFFQECHMEEGNDG